MTRPRTIESLFRRLARDSACNSALSTPGREALSFPELYDLIDEVRSWFSSNGLGPGDRIGLAIPERPEMAAAFIATACSATAVPMNSGATSTESEAQLALLGVTALIVSKTSPSGCREAAARLGISVIDLTPLPERPTGCFQLHGERQCPESSRTALAGEDIALLMATSGTTNTPKLVPISHDLALARARVEADAFELGPDDCCLNFRPLYLHSGLNAGLLVPLCVGGSVVLPNDFDAHSFPDLLLEHRVTWFLGNPAYNEAIIERYRDNGDKGGTRAQSHLRFIRSSSYSLPPDQMAALENLFGVPVLERYGGTEAGIIARNPPPPEERRPGTAGRAVDSEIAVVDDRGEPLAPGVTGEIVVKGKCVVNACQGAAHASSAAFFGDWYRTGDLGSLDRDGYLRIIGRQQDFINRGGLKISVHEVERTLLEHPAVAEAACFPVRHPTLGEEVWAAVIFSAPAGTDEADVLAFARRFLAESKVPRRLIVVDDLPRTETGKLKRFELAAVYGSEPSAARLGVPRKKRFNSPMQSALAALWCDVLGIDGLGLDDDFFMLGGDSLSAVRLLVAVEDVFGVELPIGIVFDQGRTIEGMASAIESLRAGVRVGDVSLEVERAGAELLHDGPVPRPDGRADCPLTFSQQRLWFLSQLETAAGVYNMQGAVSLRGKLDLAILRRVLNAIVHRHESLRACFPVVDGKPVQRFITSLTLALPVSDLSDLDEDRQASEVQRIALNEAEKPYSLADGPLIRSRLLKLSEQVHVLLLPKHHLIFDGQSSGILYREIGQLYEAFSNGRASPLPPLAIQYGDFARWQRQVMTGTRLERALKFWRDTLADAPPLLELPTDRPRPPIQSYRGNRHWFSLPKDLSQRFASLARAEGVTLYIALLAAFQVLLYRYSGQRDFVLGSVVGGRTRAETEPLLGFFVNTLALRVDLSGTPGFRELLQRVRKATVAAFAHQDMPFDRLVEELRPERNASYAPLVQVLFGIMPKDHRVFELPGLTIERLNVDLGTARFDLSLMMSQEQEVLEGTLEFSTDLFDETTVRRMTKHFEHLLHSVVEMPDLKINRIELMDGEEHRALTELCNNTASDIAGGQCIHNIFDARAAAHPDRIAAITNGCSVTYGELRTRSNRFAARLLEKGVSPGNPVGVCLAPGNDAVVALLGILKAGGAYVPLDLAQPIGRLRFQIADAGVKVIVTEVASLNTVSDRTCQVVTLQEQSDDPVGEVAAEAPLPQVTTSSPAYVLFTSGSTGTPKGVVVPHRAISRLVLAPNYVPLDADSTVLWSSSPYFDASTFEIWGPLLNGGKCVVVPERLPSFARLGSVIRNHDVNTLFLTTALFNVIIDDAPETLLGVRHILVGGEPLSVAHMRRARRALNSARLINAYGPTETTTFALFHEIEDKDLAAGSIPVGRPITNTTAYVVDSELARVPVGVIGEICIGGPGVALGYLNRPELSDNKFFPDPFSQLPNGRMFRTGDLGKLRSDGLIEFVGRDDRQVKIRGHRIEPAEIETVLAEHPGVKSAAVVQIAGGPGRGELAAFIIAASGHSGESIGPLREYLKSRLPHYMIPKFIAERSEFPRTDTGKLDRSALEQVLWIEEHDTGAGTGTERIIIQIWQDLLGTSEIGRSADFFSLGGHSIKAMQLTYRLEERFGIDLSMLTVFEKPTVRELAVAVDALSPQEKGDSSSP